MFSPHGGWHHLELGIQESPAEVTMPFMTLLQKSHTALSILLCCSHGKPRFSAHGASTGQGYWEVQILGEQDQTTTASWNGRAGAVFRDLCLSNLMWYLRTKRSETLSSLLQGSATLLVTLDSGHRSACREAWSPGLTSIPALTKAEAML